MKKLINCKTIFTLLFTIIFINCTDKEPLEKNDNLEISILNLQDITFTSIKINTKLSNKDDDEIKEHGICWSTTPNASIENYRTYKHNNI